LIQFCLYLDLTSCIAEIFSYFLMTSLRILSGLVYPLTLLRNSISAASRRDIGGSIILKCIFHKENGVVGWFDVAQDRERWRFLWTVMKLRVPKDCETRSYMLRHCDITSCFISVCNLLCCLTQNHRLMVLKQGTETNDCCSEANKPSTFNRS
jgi:hypothetical protein